MAVFFLCTACRYGTDKEHTDYRSDVTPIETSESIDSKQTSEGILLSESIEPDQTSDSISPSEEMDTFPDHIGTSKLVFREDMPILDHSNGVASVYRVIYPDERANVLPNDTWTSLYDDSDIHHSFSVVCTWFNGGTGMETMPTLYQTPYEVMKETVDTIEIVSSGDMKSFAELPNGPDFSEKDRFFRVTYDLSACPDAIFAETEAVRPDCSTIYYYPLINPRIDGIPVNAYIHNETPGNWRAVYEWDDVVAPTIMASLYPSREMLECENQIVDFNQLPPLEIVETIQENVPLKSFDEVKGGLKDGLNYVTKTCVPEEVYMFAAELVYIPLGVFDPETKSCVIPEAVLVPCWKAYCLEFMPGGPVVFEGVYVNAITGEMMYSPRYEANSSEFFWGTI